jgi:hypothetical protein
MTNNNKVRGHVSQKCRDEHRKSLLRPVFFFSKRYSIKVTQNKKQGVSLTLPQD